MSQLSPQRQSPDLNAARTIIEEAFAHQIPRGLSMRLWDGSEIGRRSHPECTIVFHDLQTFRSCLASRDLSRMGEAYVEGRMDIEGDLRSAVRLASGLRRVDKETGETGNGRRQTPDRAGEDFREANRKDVRKHYDLSDDFFRLFLDERMVYSCAYFASPEQTLEKAQERKLDLVCRKLELRPGERVLDVGCGWGAFLIWAAQHYGVRAHGITLSEHQADETRRRIQDAGLSNRVTVELQHYEELPAESFDKISSIGMYEHVGTSNLPRYFDAMYRALRPGGLFMNHGITRPLSVRGNNGGTFIRQFVFPGSELSSAGHLLIHMEETGFECLDVQSLRPHYALTLDEWFRRYQRRRSEAAAYVPERILRVWDLYLPGCAEAFENGMIGLHQILAAKPNPWGRHRVGFTRRETLLHDELKANRAA